MTSFLKKMPVFVAVALLAFFVHANGAAAITKCVGQPTTLNWTSSNVAASGCTLTPNTDNFTYCNYQPSPDSSGSKGISLPSGSCSVSLTCGSATKSDTLTIDTTKTWDSTSQTCVTPSTGPGAVNGSCGSTHYNCNSGTSVNNASSAGGYTWTCQGSNGGTSASCSEAAAASPSCNVTWSPSSVSPGGGSTLFWSSSNATYCSFTLSGPFPGSGNTSAGWPFNNSTGWGYGPLNSNESLSMSCWNGSVGPTTCSGTVAVNSGTNNASCYALSAPTSVNAGQTFNANVGMINNGTTNWTSAAGYKLGSQPQDNWIWGTNRVALPYSVAPGGSANIAFTPTAPTAAGTYPFGWEMVQEGVQWFGSACSQNITVNNPAPIGWLDSASCSSVAAGWACDPSNYSQSLNIDVYRDGPAGGGGVFVGTYAANASRPDVGPSCGGTTLHGYNGPTAIAAGLADGATHNIYAYAADTPSGADTLLLGNPKPITCTGPVNGACSTAHYGCTAGTSSNHANNGGTFTWSCVGSNGGTTASCTEVAAGPVGVSLTQSASCTTSDGTTGQPFTLSWGSTNATSCSLSKQPPGGSPGQVVSCYGNPTGPYSDAFHLNGSCQPTPIALGTHTFTFTCGSASQSVSHTVASSCPCTNGANNPPTCNTFNPCANGATNPPTCNSCPAGYTYNGSSCVANTPTASISAAPSTIDNGQSSTLTWSSTNATSCTAAGGFSTGNATSGSAVVRPSTTSNYQISCSGAGGSVNSNIATVTVLQPTATISANPTRIHSGDSSTVSWSASQVNSCTISGPGLSSTNLSGSKNIPNITAQSTYTITCQTNGSPITQSVIIDVAPSFQEF